jgi:hypothetical protein
MTAVSLSESFIKVKYITVTVCIILQEKKMVNGKPSGDPIKDEG